MFPATFLTEPALPAEPESEVISPPPRTISVLSHCDRDASGFGGRAAFRRQTLDAGEENQPGSVDDNVAGSHTDRPGVTG